VHAFVNDQERSIGTYLYGRRMYETMASWERMVSDSEVMQEYAEIWRAAEKVVYSRTLESVGSARTRLERTVDPSAIRRMKDAAARDLSIGGAELAGVALSAGLVDECRLFLCPVVVGGGKRAFGEGLRIQLDLIDERRFACGVVYLRYAVPKMPPARE
jgi:dihydrofolate reductase